jgi:alginate O-acetyltransferase complex protein AlgI
MWWDPKYALLIITTTIIVYATALLMHGRTQRIKKLCVAFSVLSNLGILFMFKYFNFFNNSIHDLFTAAGIGYPVPALNLLLPVGISFYTFQALSYTIDVYRGTREPEKHFGMFALYVSFFPTLLSGPIERSTRLLPQLYRKVDFDYERVVNGLILMGWGFFQKLVIADRLAQYANLVYSSPQMFKGLPLLMATYFFAIQVYCDFSGYTDIAIGTAQVMGYELMPNFKRPFFARSIGDLWRRWHISLISWFREYLYIPLGGNRVSRWRLYFNILLVFTLSGLWHGAQWTFVTWGALNGVLIIMSRVTDRVRTAIRDRVFGGLAQVPAAVFFGLTALLAGGAVAGGMAGIGWGGRIAAGIGFLALLPLGIMKARGSVFTKFCESLKGFWMVVATFHLFVLGAVFFRAKSLTDAWYVLTHFAGTNILQVPLIYKLSELGIMLGVIILLNVIHLVQERYGSIRKLIREKPLPVRWALYYLLVMTIFLGMQKSSQFIYFQF